MTTNTPPAPVPFTKDDYAARMARMARVTQDAVQAGLAGLTVAPGPDLVWHRAIEPGDAVVLDFGGLYGSDTTRTVTVSEPSPEIQKVHDIVRSAQEAGVDAVRPGVTCQDIDRAARAVITDAGYGENFIHRTGHGIGTTTHEPPYMVVGEDQPLVPGTCFSVEPGIYLSGRFGVRIGDIVTVTADGGRRFNNTDHGIHVVE